MVEDVHLLVLHEPFEFPEHPVPINGMIVHALTLLHRQVPQPDGGRMYRCLTEFPSRTPGCVVPLSTLTFELDGGRLWPQVADWERVANALVDLARSQACDAIHLGLPHLSLVLLASGPNTIIHVTEPDGSPTELGGRERQERLDDLTRRVRAFVTRAPFFPGVDLMAPPREPAKMPYMPHKPVGSQPIGQPRGLGSEMGVVGGEHVKLGKELIVCADLAQGVRRGAGGVGDDGDVAGVGLGLSGVQVSGPAHRQLGQVGHLDAQRTGDLDRQGYDRDFWERKPPTGLVVALCLIAAAIVGTILIGVIQKHNTEIGSDLTWLCIIISTSVQVGIMAYLGESWFYHDPLEKLAIAAAGIVAPIVIFFALVLLYTLALVAIIVGVLTLVMVLLVFAFICTIR